MKMLCVNLKAYREANELAVDIYEITEGFPSRENFGISSQMRRAAVSVPSNIIEGKARNSDKEFLRFLNISRGSLEELKYQVYLSNRLKYISINDYEVLCKKLMLVGVLLDGLIKKIKSRVR